jgi:hypothetical protein
LVKNLKAGHLLTGDAPLPMLEALSAFLPKTIGRSDDPDLAAAITRL